MTEYTQNLELPIIDSKQSDAMALYNEAMAKLDTGGGAVNGVPKLYLAGDPQNTPPGSPVEGILYQVGNAGTGDFAEHDTELAAYTGNSWVFFTPFNGMVAAGHTGSVEQYSRHIYCQEHSVWVPIALPDSGVEQYNWTTGALALTQYGYQAGRRITFQDDNPSASFALTLPALSDNTGTTIIDWNPSTDKDNVFPEIEIIANQRYTIPTTALLDWFRISVQAQQSLDTGTCNAAAVNDVDGLASIDLGDTLANVGQVIEFSGTTNYDAVYKVIKHDTGNRYIIGCPYMAETLAGTETWTTHVGVGHEKEYVIDSPQIVRFRRVNGIWELVYREYIDGVARDFTTRVSTDYYAKYIDYIIFADSTSADIDIDLPRGREGQHYKIINCGSGGNSVTVDPYSTETILGGSTAILADGEIVDIHYNRQEYWW